MRFLIDAQSPPALVRWQEGRGHQAEHVADRGLASASDREIWDLAYSIESVIVTKDEDFVSMQTLNPKGPAVIWIRIGNTTSKVLLANRERSIDDIEKALLAGERLIEVV